MNYLQITNSLITFAALEPAKPLNNAQIGGSFFYYTSMRTNFTKHYSSLEQIINILKTRGMPISNEQRTKNYLLNIGYHRLSAYIYPFYQNPKCNLKLKKTQLLTKF